MVTLWLLWHLKNLQTNVLFRTLIFPSLFRMRCSAILFLRNLRPFSTNFKLANGCWRFYKHKDIPLPNFVFVYIPSRNFWFPARCRTLPQKTLDTKNTPIFFGVHVKNRGKLGVPTYIFDTEIGQCFPLTMTPIFTQS